MNIIQLQYSSFVQCVLEIIGISIKMCVTVFQLIQLHQLYLENQFH